jgi:hypothetical protein
VEQLKAKARTQTTEMILDCLLMIGGGHVSEDERMVRAALIDVYIERTSPEDGDTLMDILGL